MSKAGLERVVAHFAAIRRELEKPSALGPVDHFRAVCDTIMFEGGGAAPLEPQPALGSPVAAEWFCAEGIDRDRRLLLLHAGSFVAFSQRSYRRFASHMSAATGAAVLVCDYGLAPEHPFPAALDDVHATFLWMRAHGPDGARPARSAFVGGDSAGGTLTLANLLLLRDRGEPLPDAAFAISPITDLTASGGSYESRREADPLSSRQAVLGSAALYLAGADPRNPYASPLFGDLAGLPPTLILVGDAEVILDDSLRFGAKAREAGSDVRVEAWPEMIHCWPLFHDVLAEGREAIAQIDRFLRSVG